jgi:hypothetical protein
MYYGVPADERLPPPAATEIAPSLQTFEPIHHRTASNNNPTQIPSLTVIEPTPEEVSNQNAYFTGSQSQKQPEHQPQKEFIPPPAEWDATR